MVLVHEYEPPIRVLEGQGEEEKEETREIII